MPAYVNANNALSTLAGNISAVDTTFTLTVGTSFPLVTGGNWTYVTFQDAANNIEIVKVTEHGDGTDSFTCVRGQENTPARAWIAGDFVECRFTAGVTVTVDGVQTLTNKTILSPTLRFGDGSLAAPGISWANEPTTGFARTGGSVMAAVINTQNVMQWQPSATVFNTPAYFPGSSSINFLNGAGNTHWGAMVTGGNVLYIGSGGWSNTYIYGGSAPNINVHAGGVAFAGNVTGVTAAMVGLGNVYNVGQIRELRQGSHAISVGWVGKLDVNVDGTYFGTTWPIDISGGANAANIASNANAVNGISGWNYQNRQRNPLYLWCSDGSVSDQYLTQPGFLAVGYAGNAGQVNGYGGWTYSNTNDNPTYIWATHGNPQHQFLAARENLSVAYARNATRADTAGYADVAGRLDGGNPDGGNSSIHPDSEITMADGSTKWLRDVRLGDTVKGRDGPAEVLGIWTNTLQERSVWEVTTDEGAVACTPGHLFPIMVDGVEAWGAPVPEMYWRNSHGRKRTVKGRRGLIDTLSLVVGDEESVHTMGPGALVYHVSGKWVPVTGLREVSVRGSGYDSGTKRSAATRVNENQQVIALYLEGSKVFYADGHAVATLA